MTEKSGELKNLKGEPKASRANGRKERDPS